MNQAEPTLAPSPPAVEARPSPDGAHTEPAGGWPLLEARALTVLHGQLQALTGVSLSLEAGSVLAVIGANGAGKSTLLRTLAGLHAPAHGSILLDGEDVTGLDAVHRARLGIVMVPEGRRLFPSLTVEENILAGTYRARAGPWNLERIYELFDWMPARRRQRAYQLSGGEQQAVAIARALVANPRVLLLDELSLGLAPVVVRRIYARLPDILAEGVGVLVVEQDVSQAMRIAARVQCLLEGRTTLAGRPAELNPDAIEAAYFGVERAEGRRPAAEAPVTAGEGGSHGLG